MKSTTTKDTTYQEYYKKIQKKYQDLLVLKDFGYCEPLSFCATPCYSDNNSITQNSQRNSNSLLNDKDTVYSFGCGDPISRAEIQRGEIILDLGCGCGADSICAAQKLMQLVHGHTTSTISNSIPENMPNKILSDKQNNPIAYDKGYVVGIDMLEEMLARAQKEAQRLKLTNIHFVHAFMEELPLKDNSFDLIMSNCVINLSPNKERVFQEAHRVLKKNSSPANKSGRVLFSDIISKQEIPRNIQENDALLYSCIGGVITERNYIEAFEKIGFQHIEILQKQAIFLKNDAFIEKYNGTQNLLAHSLKDIQLSKILIRAYA